MLNTIIYRYISKTDLKFVDFIAQKNYKNGNQKVQMYLITQWIKQQINCHSQFKAIPIEIKQNHMRFEYIIYYNFGKVVKP